ncbi:unnamed protein product [Urochloa humidicola]
MALESEGGGGAAAARAKRQRVDEQAGHRKDVAPGSEETPAGHISALPDDLRRRILTHLPLKDAIRTGALAQGWRDLWKSRWADPTSCRDIHLLPGDKPRKVLESLESVPRRRLDRFSFVSDYEKLRQPYLKRFLAYAAGCRVEDLRVDLSRCHWRLTFHLPLSSPLLAHLSLRSVDMCHMYYKGARPFYALESIHLHSVSCSVKFSKVTELCPRLHTLDLRRCHFFWPHAGRYQSLQPAQNLRRITVAECYSEKVTMGVVAPDLPVPSLCSFRYSGRFLDCFFFLAKNAALTDLYICFSDFQPIDHLSFFYKFQEALPRDLSGLSVLTISSNAVRIACSVFNMTETSYWTKMNNLRSLRELQLLILGMENDMDNLANIYLFLKACRCSNLERLFVQLPATSDVPLEDLVGEPQVLPPEDVLAKLRMVKVMNFNWRLFEVQLVSLLLRKATSLHKLLLVSPNVNPQYVPGVQEADLLLLKEALASGRIIVSKSDDPATQPFHSEVFIKI